jgi:hypothetical protein
MAPLRGDASGPGEAGVRGDSVQWNGVLGQSQAPGQAGVAGVNENGGNGIYGRGTAQGVWGHGYLVPDAVGVVGISDHNDGVRGFTSTQGKSGVAGIHQGSGGQGVWGSADQGRGVVGLSKIGTGVYGHSDQDEGVRGESGNPQHGGVVGVSFAKGGHGVYGTCDEGTGVIAVTKNGNALYAKADQGNAAVLDGHVRVTGNLIVVGDIQLAGADLAENFEVDGHVEPGTVMVLDGIDRIRVATGAYDHRVVGVISGAGDYRPAVVLDHREQHVGQRPLALVGKVYCKVDASYAPVELGDLLTTSMTPGHAMKATDPGRAFGAVLGKAMATLDHGVGLVPIFVTLH